MSVNIRFSPVLSGLSPISGVYLPLSPNYITRERGMDRTLILVCRPATPGTGRQDLEIDAQSEAGEVTHLK
jgi:hypothetical protein